VPPEPHRDEHTSASRWFSPGLVQSDEIVLRTVLDPDHLEPNGNLAAAAISLEDIRFRGWSVDRKRFTCLWRVRFFHSGWKKRRPNIRRFYVLPLPVGVIRQPDPATGQQQFVVTDAAKWLNPAHAHVLLSASQGEGAARGYRTKLLQRLPPYVDVATAFTPVDKHGCVRGMLKQFGAIVVAAADYVRRRLGLGT
jgi:hypothetical protein